MIRKIVIIGPESTGKSTLCSMLADHYHTVWCPEYAREYLLKNGTDYSFEDLATIAKGQLALEEEYVQRIQKEYAIELAAGKTIPLFIDTDMYVMKVWCEFVFGKCHPFILKEIAARKYDYYLLCNTDIEWVKDELREYPDVATRNILFKMYKDLLVNQATPWTEIQSPDYTKRFEQAVKVMDEHFR